MTAASESSDQQRVSFEKQQETSDFRTQSTSNGFVPLDIPDMISSRCDDCSQREFRSEVARCLSRGRQHDSNMRGMMVIFFSICLQRGVKDLQWPIVKRLCPRNSTIVKLKMLVKWLGPGMAQG